jgi:3-hydroxybutyryl-CoA dehydratase
MLKQSDLEAGQRLTRPGPPLTLQAFTDFGALLGTDAPIHNDPAYAAKTPFGVVIAQGPLLLACFETWFCELFGEDAWSRTGRLAAKFVSPAKIGETVMLEIIVGETLEGRANFELRVVHEDRLLAVGSAAISVQ